MKSIIISFALLLICTGAVSQANNKIPAAWGHYQKLSNLSAASTPGMEGFDTLRFVLETGETRIEHIERNESGPRAPITKPSKMQRI